MKRIILDRDGVINEDSEAYIKSLDEWIPIPGSIKAIARLNHAGYAIYIATNQSGLARGFFDLTILNNIHHYLRNLLAEQNATLAGIYFCPHLPEDNCHCRKPLPGLFESIAKDSGTDDLHEVFAVGDSLRDLQAAEAASAIPILVRTGKGKHTLDKLGENHTYPVFNNLASFVDHLLNK